MNFKKYRKISLTVARPLTHADYIAFNGVIGTLEGSKAFEVGAYLARDSKGVWPITQANIETNYKQVSEPDSEGFAQYQPQDIREAAQMQASFITGGLTGKAGDYLVRRWRL